MQPTVSSGPAWWWWTASSGSRRAPRRRVRVLHLPRSGLALTLYTPDQIRHIIRLESSVHRVTEVPWAAPEHWPIHDLVQNVRVGRPPYSGLSGGHTEGPEGTAEGRDGWEGTLRGWAAGALLLAAVLLLVRALERCLHRKLFKGQSASEDWSTPRVIATTDYPRLREGDDLPPPYAAVTASPQDKPTEEPPPPYSACYFANPKDMPTVHFYRRRDTNIEAGQSSSNATNDNDNAEVKVEEERIQCEVDVCDERSVYEPRSDESSGTTENSRNYIRDNANPETSNTVYNV